ncbi:hypothetical protein SAMN02745121_06245 [Nannocystis exedens]|uniref:Uncharacterized protein n=1 Tax=Nannocystis exedens TaxID=54 RepID=A0A1I2ES54_9BACT|nr:hypothetical protein NAEX_06924 [Nannocystis exedens]SFE95553.1 hypothetical protein SAMN02745121_06245 [Nannocystis exedens]
MAAAAPSPGVAQRAAVGEHGPAIGPSRAKPAPLVAADVAAPRIALGKLRDESPRAPTASHRRTEANTLSARSNAAIVASRRARRECWVWLYGLLTIEFTLKLAPTNDAPPLERHAAGVWEETSCQTGIKTGSETRDRRTVRNGGRSGRRSVATSVRATSVTSGGKTNDAASASSRTGKKSAATSGASDSSHRRTGAAICGSGSPAFVSTMSSRLKVDRVEDDRSPTRARGLARTLAQPPRTGTRTWPVAI